MTRHLLHSSEDGRESHLTQSRDGAPRPGAGWRGATLPARGNAARKHVPQHANALLARVRSAGGATLQGLSSASDAISARGCQGMRGSVANPALAPWAGPASAQQQSQHEPQHVLSSQHEHTLITSLPVTQDRRAPGARRRIGAARAAHRGQHAGQFAAQRREPRHLLVDLADVPAQQHLGRPARAAARVADRQQFPDFGQPQPEPPRTADEQQPVHVGRPVPAVIALGPPWRREQTGPLVIPDRVGTDPGTRGQLADRPLPGSMIEVHTPTLNPGPYSRFKPRSAAGRYGIRGPREARRRPLWS